MLTLYLSTFGVAQNHQRSGSQPLEWMGQNLQHGRVTIAGTGCQHHWNTQLLDTRLASPLSEADL